MSSRIRDPPTRPLTEREKVYFQGLIDDMYVQFVEASPTAGRWICRKCEHWRMAASLREGMRREKKLIDEIGNFQDAVDLTAKLLALSGKPEFASQQPTASDIAGCVDKGPVAPRCRFNGTALKSQIRFQYLWK